MRRSLLLLAAAVAAPARAEPLPATRALDDKGDLARLMVDGLHKYLDRELAASVERHKAFWKVDLSSPEAYQKSVEPNRQRLRKVLGVVDERVPFRDLDYVAGPATPALVAETETFRAYAVRWPVLPGVEADGLLLEPKGAVKRDVVAVPDADWPPEMVCGLEPKPRPERFGALPPAMKDEATYERLWQEAQFARRLAENGCRVLVPALIDRQDTWSGSPALGRMTNQPHREFVYRMAYQMGRHPLGYEVQKVLAAVDWLCRAPGHAPVGLIGYGEGGRVAFYAGALDGRVGRVVIGGAFGPQEELWREPIYRNVWGLLREFGDAEVAAHLYYPPQARPGPRAFKLLVVDNGLPPLRDGPPPPREGRGGAAVGRLGQSPLTVGEAEFDRSRKLGPPQGERTEPLYNQIGPGAASRFLFAPADTLDALTGNPKPLGPAPVDLRKDFDPATRQKRQFDQLVAFTQKLMRDSEAQRAKTFWAKLDTSSPEKYAASCAPFRKQLAEEVIGQLPAPTVPMNPRSRQVYDEPKWAGWEVTLDLFPDVFASGILLLPKDLKPGEKRPVVVCQHGLEGRPRDVCDPKMRTRYYNSFGAQLADLGYVVYAPQNPYIFEDDFRLLQRKANPLGLSLFSFIAAQHARHLDWLAALPMVDPDKIAFYGLSYGGKTAMRVPALLPRYCLSICSGDFNEWTWKNVSVDFRGSYMFTREWEMPEFDLGNTIVYAEMAALIAPRPFMVERGHDDGVGIDEWVAYEYAKVRRLYSRLKMPEKTEIEFFAGGHEIHGQGTFRFLKRHLIWPR